MPKDRLAATGKGPVIILVDPQMGENIGASARAMLNFGLTRLRLVRPRDGWPNERAGAMAAGAGEILDRVRLFDSVAEAVSDCHCVLATTARRREALLEVFSPREATHKLYQHIEQEGQNCAILFGGERSGLEARDLACAQGIISIPVNPGFSSLNLAQAVLLIAYEWGLTGRALSQIQTREAAVPAPQSAVEGLATHLFAELEKAGYFYPPEKRPLMERNLRVALGRAGWSDPEIQTLRGVVRVLAEGRGPSRKISNPPTSKRN